MRDAATQFEALGVEVHGISLDDVAALAKFHKQEELSFGLLSDPDGSAAKKYGVLGRKYARRVSFVLDPKGLVRHVEERVQVKSHGSDLAELIRGLQE